jgi:hypothetical protein
LTNLKIAFVILILALSLNYPSTTYAQPNVCGFYGTVTLDGAPVEDGVVIDAWIDGVTVASTTTYTNTNVDPPIPSYYALTINGTGQDFEGKRGTFTVGDENLDTNCPCIAAPDFTYESGINAGFNLTALTSTVVEDCFSDILLSPKTGFSTNVCGKCFVWNNPVKVYFGPLEVDGEFVHELVATGNTDSEGSFCIPFIPPTTEPGEYDITVIDLLEITAKATFTIPALATDECQPCDRGQPGPPGEPGIAGVKGKGANPTISFIGLIVSIIAATLVMVIARRPKQKER